MDKYELKITLREINSLIDNGQLEEAVDLADSVDWRKVKSIRELCRVSDLYKANRRYEDSRRILELAYVKYPKGRQILFSLCELELKLGNYVRALQIYNEFVRIAPEDSERYILQYKIYKTQDVGIREKIAVLEELERRDFREKWAYELASLYYQAGERSLCISECDELIAFFGTGRYVLKALELKGSLTDLTPSQKKRYAAMMRASGKREAAGRADSPVMHDLKKPPQPEQKAEETGNMREPSPDGPWHSSDPQESASEGSEFSMEPQEPAAEGFGSSSEQQEPAAVDFGSQPELNARNEEPEQAGVQPENMDKPVTQEAEDGAASRQTSEEGDLQKAADDSAGKAGVSTDTLVFSPVLSRGYEADEFIGSEPLPDLFSPGAMTDTGAYQTDDLLPQLDPGDLPKEIPWDYEEEPGRQYAGSSAGNRGAQSSRTDSADSTDISAGADARRQETAGSTSGSARRQETTDTDLWDLGEKIRSGEHFAQEGMISDEEIQKVVAKGLEELHNYDTYLSQETDGQYALVMQEDTAAEQQVPGQLNLEEIMSEWEKVRRDLYETPSQGRETGKGKTGRRGEGIALRDDTSGDNRKGSAGNAGTDSTASKEIDVLTQTGRDGAPEYGASAKVRKRNTKSWDPEVVHNALRIRDNDEEGVRFDTSLFVTEDAGEFPPEYVTELPMEPSPASAASGAASTSSAAQRASGGSAVRGRTATGNMPYLHSEDSIRRMMDALEFVKLEGAEGNIVITGDEGSGTMSLAREILLRYRSQNADFVGQTVKTEGYLIERDNLCRVIPRIPFGALVIQHAASMSEEAASALEELLTEQERFVLILLIDRKGIMDAFLRDHRRLSRMFTARVDIDALSVETLIGYAIEYAESQNCRIGEYGLNALQSRILSMQTVQHSVTLENVRELVDEAVYYAGRRFLPELRRTITGRRGEGILELRDRDFLHYL